MRSWSSRTTIATITWEIGARAALDGCAEVMVPVLVATCTTNIVLAPIALMPGMGGFLFRPLALAVTFSMVTSFILSRTFVPMMCAKFLPDEHGRKRKGIITSEEHVEQARPGVFGRAHRRIEIFLEGLTRRYEGLLAIALRHRFLVLGFVLLLFVGSLMLTFGIGREFFPQVDAGQITVYLRTPSSSRLDAAEGRLAQFEQVVLENIPAREREMIITELGLDPDWSAAYSANSGQQRRRAVQLNSAAQCSGICNQVAPACSSARPRFADLRQLRHEAAWCRRHQSGLVFTDRRGSAGQPARRRVRSRQKRFAITSPAMAAP